MKRSTFAIVLLINVAAVFFAGCHQFFKYSSGETTIIPIADSGQALADIGSAATDDASRLDTLQVDAFYSKDTLINSDSSSVGAFYTLPAATFLMGSPTNEQCRNTNETQHEVVLTHSFEISPTEVTQQQFFSTLGYNPSLFVSCGANCPVESCKRPSRSVEK